MTVDKSKLQNSPFGSVTTSAVNLRQTFNNTQNWTVPNDVNGIWVHLVGGGQGGGSRNTGGQTANGSGGVGGNGVFAFTPVTPGSIVGMTIGAGGSGGTIQANTSSAQVGNEGGLTYVNTSGASWVAGGGLKNGSPNPTNTSNQVGYQGKLYGLSRQQIVFSDKANSGRISQQFSIKEGVGFGGANQEWEYNSSSAGSFDQRAGRSSVYGGGSGGGAVTNSSGGGSGATGGAQTATGRTGGAGAAWVSANSGGGGGGAGITGNGAAASGTNGGAGGAGGGGGGGGGAANATTGCTGGAGGAGAVLIYY
jgi:hypothetical protein